MNEAPKTVNDQKPEPLLDKVKNVLANKAWIKEYVIRVREEGHIYFSEGFVVPVDGIDLTRNIKNTINAIEKLEWRIQEFMIMPVKELPEDYEQLSLIETKLYCHKINLKNSIYDC